MYCIVDPNKGISNVKYELQSTGNYLFVCGTYVLAGNLISPLLQKGLASADIDGRDLVLLLDILRRYRG